MAYQYKVPHVIKVDATSKFVSPSTVFPLTKSRSPENIVYAQTVTTNNQPKNSINLLNIYALP